MCSAKGRVRFSPNSDRESEFRKRSCLLRPRKRTCAAHNLHVCFWAKCDRPCTETIAQPIRFISWGRLKRLLWRSRVTELLSLAATQLFDPGFDNRADRRNATIVLFRRKHPMHREIERIRRVVIGLGVTVYSIAIFLALDRSEE